LDPFLIAVTVCRDSAFILRWPTRVNAATRMLCALIGRIRVRPGPGSMRRTAVDTALVLAAVQRVILATFSTRDCFLCLETHVCSAADKNPICVAAGTRVSSALNEAWRSMVYALPTQTAWTARLALWVLQV
jgi:hypothetical protein